MTKTQQQTAKDTREIAKHLRACAENEGGRALLCVKGYGNVDSAYYFAREAGRYARLLLSLGRPQ